MTPPTPAAQGEPDEEHGRNRPAWRIEVDRHACAGSGLCLATAHGLLRLDSGRSRAVTELIAPDARVVDAAEICPMEAITVRHAGTGEVLAPLR
ncbi:ferredoxin [Streptomyces sp. NPDC101062]|uniref:ferredoxin n=1 Tax=unclassified Streptomyces TaxID=2593676 RepID=UPI002E791485|nr:ferredoxin [Streptomyces sp. JV176]MEE1798985.1 ferredoxin [Streptomyces sp. JV176]